MAEEMTYQHLHIIFLSTFFLFLFFHIFCIWGENVYRLILSIYLTLVTCSPSPSPADLWCYGSDFVQVILFDVTVPGVRLCRLRPTGWTCFISVLLQGNRRLLRTGGGGGKLKKKKVTIFYIFLFTNVD